MSCCAIGMLCILEYVISFLELPTGPKLDQIIHITQSVYQITTIGLTFAVTGIGGLLVAIHKVRTEWRKVDFNTESVYRRVDQDINVRREQHLINAKRLEQLQTDVDGLQNQLKDIRSLLDKVLTKMAGL